MRTRLAVMMVAALVLNACGESGHEATAPAPGELTREAIGYYCNMIVVDHHGPKGQVFIRGRDQPIWFASVRDTIAFTFLPEEPKNIAAIYVSDMGRASWDRPEPGTWIDAHRALYVVGSDKVGGMGAPEAVPFAEQSAAEAFASRHGGHVVPFDKVPRGYVLAVAPAPMQHAHENSNGKVVK
jgi:copper chaperone NosL